MPITLELTEFTANLAGAWIIAVTGSTLFLLMCRAYLALQRHMRSRSFFAAEFRHPPGHEARGKLRERVREVHALMAAIALLPLFFGAALLAGSAEVMAGTQTSYWLATLLVVTAIAAYHGYMLVRHIMDLASMRYTLLADMAVSLGLERVSRRDFTVFHDVPLGDTRITKVVLGKQGVFVLLLCIHPRSRSKLETPNAARFDGRGVHFPDGTAVEMMQQAQAAANQAAARFSKATGSSIKVCPVLAVPGWRIECAEQPAFPVVNECNIDMITSWVRPEDSLLDEEYEQIETLLNEACRDRRYKRQNDSEGGLPSTGTVTV